jgi:hypothetical protein
MMVRSPSNERHCRYPPAIKRPALRSRAEGRLTAQNDVEAAAAAVPPMRSAHRRDFSSVGRRGKPIVDRGTDPAALHGGLARPGMASDQQDHPLAVNDRLPERAVDGVPGGVEPMAMEVDNAIRLDAA